MIEILPAKFKIFLKSIKTSSPTGITGATTLPLLGHSFMYTETSANNHGQNVFCSFERTDLFQISFISLYSNRFSAGNVKALGFNLC